MNLRGFALLLLLTSVLTSCSRFSSDPDLMATATAVSSKVFATLTAEAGGTLAGVAATPEPIVEPETTMDKIKNAAKGLVDTVSKPQRINASELVPMPADKPAAQPLPTVTVTPKPTVQHATVIAEALNVRSGPDTSFSIVTSVTVGDSLKIVGRNEEGTWFQIVTPQNETGWVFGELVAVG